jgi:hypothetical protein
MAYIKTEEVREIRKELKKQFPSWKFSVRRNSGQHAVDINILKGTADFWKDFTTSDWMVNYKPVNEYFLDKNWNKINTKELNKIIKIIKTAPAKAEGGRAWYDKSDARFDIFDTAFYIHLQVGNYDNPYEVI